MKCKFKEKNDFYNANKTSVKYLYLNLYGLLLLENKKFHWVDIKLIKIQNHKAGINIWCTPPWREQDHWVYSHKTLIHRSWIIP